MNIYDVAKEAGVSIATVSRVINSPSLVSVKTRKKVDEILLKHNYTPNAMARGLVVKSMKTIGVLTIDIRDAYYANVAYTIEHEFSKCGYTVILCNTGGDAEEKARYIKVLAEKKVDGMILVGSVFSDRKIDKSIENIAQTIPVVAVNGYANAKNTYSIICDDASGITGCVEHLYNLGHRKLVYLQDTDTFSAQSKVQGFLNGIKKFDLSPSDCMVVNVEKGIDGAIAAVDKLINNGTDFTGLIAGEDITAIGAMNRLASLGKRIPEDVSVIGFNNSSMTRCCTPELTSVDNKMESMGVGAVRILSDVLEGRNVALKTVITPDLIVRSSTGRV
jgi:LacI family transcriptional regulator